MNGGNMNENNKTKRECFCGTTVCEEERRLCKEEVREIYRNLMAGKDSVETLRPMSEDGAFREVLLRQDKEYSDLCARVESYAAENGYDLKELSPMAKGMMHLSATLNALTDKSSSKLASIMLQGIDMGVISITKIVNKLHKEGAECPLAEETLDMLERNAIEMRKFL